MKSKLLEYAGIGVVIIWVVAFFIILSNSGQCRQSGSILEAQGICLWRRLAEISCIFGLELAFGVGAGLQAKARKYPFIMGFLLGFFFSVLGAFFVMTLSPKQAYKAAPLPGEKRKKLIMLVLFLVIIIFGVLLALHNLGRL